MAKIITLKWEGGEYTLNENEAFLAADAIEDHVTVGDLVKMRQDGARIRFATLAKAYAALLGEAGATVTAQQVHKAFTAAMRGDDGDDRLGLAIQAIDWLLVVLMDSAPIDDEVGDKEPKNEAKAPAS